MKGRVRFLNLQNGLAAVETKEGFSVFQVLERCAIDISDEVEGPLDAPREAPLHNLTRGETFAASILNVRCSRLEAMETME